MVNNEPVFIEVDTPNSIKDGKNVNVKNDVMNKVSVNIDADSPLETKRGTSVLFKDTSNPKTV